MHHHWTGSGGRRRRGGSIGQRGSGCGYQAIANYSSRTKRIFRVKLKAHIIRYASLFAAVILSLPLPLGILTGFYLWLSPYLFINSALASWRFAAFHGFGAAVLLLAILYHRWFCRFVCPMGALCDIASKWGSRKFTLRRVPSIHKHFFVTAFCMAVLGIPLLNLLDPINFFTMFF